jgi:HEAT repeat protein
VYKMKNIRTCMGTLIIFISFLQGCGFISTLAPAPISEKTNAELIQLLNDSANLNNENSGYPSYLIVDELKRRGPSASEAAPALAKAMTFNQRGSYQASGALIAMGSSAKSAIPYLLQNLDNGREEVRRHSVFVLGIIGEPASCAVPKIASLLWDKEPYVRSASAAALTGITNKDLVKYDDLKLDPTVPGGVNPDDPEGSISGIAREWWLNAGQNIIWSTKNCELPSQ